MELSARESSTVVVIDFAAPIPAGNEALVLTVERADARFFDTSEAELVVDLTSRIVYADSAYWTTLEARGWPSMPVTDDPIGALGPGWQVKRSFQGRIAGAILTTRDSSARNHVRTLLHVLPDLERGYRD